MTNRNRRYREKEKKEHSTYRTTATKMSKDMNNEKPPWNKEQVESADD